MTYVAKLSHAHVPSIYTRMTCYNGVSQWPVIADIRTRRDSSVGGGSVCNRMERDMRVKLYWEAAVVLGNWQSRLQLCHASLPLC